MVAARDAARYLDRADLDGERFAEVDRRVSHYYELARKFRTEPESLHELLEKSRSELKVLTGAKDVEALRKAEASARGSYDVAAARLSEARRHGALALGEAVTAQIKSLAMKGARLEIALVNQPPSASGSEHCEFLIAGHAGVQTRPLIKVASGGELARLRFAEIVLERPNLLFLDEPTNHLDIYTRENLTEALMAYTGTLLMVTHDRHLMNSLGCPILYLEDGKATLYPSYAALMGRVAPAAAPEKAGDQPAKAGYGKEQRRRRAELRAKIKACEDEMEACGAREVELDNEINSPEVYNDRQLLREKSDELSDLRFHQEELFAAWEAAMEEQEQYEQVKAGENE